MPPKKVKVKSTDDVPKASSKVASKASKTASKTKASRSTKTSKASKTTSTAAALANPAPATVAPVLNPERDIRRRTRANPSPGLKDRSGIDKEPSFNKPTIARTAIKNAATRRDQQDEESTQQESVSASHSSEPEESRSSSPELPSHSHPSTPTSSRMPGAFTTVEPSSRQAAGPSKAKPRLRTKRSRSQVSDCADTEDASSSRPAKRARTASTPSKRTDDTPFEHFNLDRAIDPVQQQLALEIEAALPSPSTFQPENTVGEQRPASNPSALSVINNEDSLCFTPQNAEAAEATEVAQATEVSQAIEGSHAIEAAQATKTTQILPVPEVIIHEAVTEDHEPELALIASPSQSSVNNNASASRSAVKSANNSASRSASKSAYRSASKSASKSAIKILRSGSGPGYMKGSHARRRSLDRMPRRTSLDVLRDDLKRRRAQLPKSKNYQPPRQRKSIDKIHISDMSSDSEELVPYNATEMRLVKQNSQGYLNIIESEKMHKEPIYVLRKDLQEKYDRMSKSRKQGGVPSAARNRKKQFPSAVINIHVQTQNGPEVFDVSPRESEILLKIQRLLAVNPDSLTADEALRALQSAMDVKKAGQAPLYTPYVGNGDSSRQNNAPTLVPEQQPSKSIRITDMGDADVDTQTELDAGAASPSPVDENTAESDTKDRIPESQPVRASPKGWVFSTMSAVKSVVSKPFFEYFGGASAAGPSTANDQSTANVQDFFSPSKIPSTPTPASRGRRGATSLRKTPSTRHKGNGKASAIDDRKIEEFQTHAKNMKNKHRKGAATSKEDDELPHAKPIYHTGPLPLYQGPPTKNTFTVPDSSDDDDDEEEGVGVAAPAGAAEPVEFAAPVETVVAPTENTSTNTNKSNTMETFDQNVMLQPQAPPPAFTLPSGLNARFDIWGSTELECFQRKRQINQANQEMDDRRDSRLREDPERYRKWVENIPNNLDHWTAAVQEHNKIRRQKGNGYELYDTIEHFPYRFLRKACLNEKGKHTNYSTEDYIVTDDDKEHLAIWHARRGTVGAFQKEAAAKKEADKKEAAAKEEADKKEAAAKEEADRKEAAANEQAKKKEAAAKEAAEREVRNVFMEMNTNVRKQSEDFVVLDGVDVYGVSPQPKWADLTLLLP